jgi:cytochrome c oxidase subunit 3
VTTTTVPTRTAAAGAVARDGGGGMERDRAAATIDALVGMTIFLGAWVMLFAALFLAYAVVRAQANEWPPFGAPRLPRAAPALNTLLLLASGLALHRGVARARVGRRRALLPALAVTMILGAGFLAGQIALWRAMSARGLLPSSGVYGSVFFALTGFHALHVLGGLVVLAVLTLGAVRARRAGAQPDDWRPARLTALYWDFVAAIWILMYLAIYWL